MQGQGCASPVPPFAGEVERFPDKPGARPLTWSSPQCGYEEVSDSETDPMSRQANGQEVKDMYRLAGTCTSPILPTV